MVCGHEIKCPIPVIIAQMLMQKQKDVNGIFANNDFLSNENVVVLCNV